MVWTQPQNWPWLVAALLGALLGMVLIWRRAAAATAQLHPSLLRLGQAGGSVRRAVLRGAALVIWALAMLGPSWGVTQAVETESSRDVILAVDASRSMRAQDVAPDRWRRVGEMVAELLRAHPGYRYSLVLFAAEAWVRVPFTFDHEFLLQTLRTTDPEEVTPQGTDFAAAFAQIVALADARGIADPVVVLISDGEHTGPDYAPALAALAERGVRVVTLAVGNPEGAPIPAGSGYLADPQTGSMVLSRPDREALAAIAAATGGMALEVDGGARDLSLLGQALAQLAAREGREVEARRRIDRAHWPIALGWLLLAASYLPLGWLAGAPRAAMAPLLLVGLALAGCRADNDAASAYAAGRYDEAAAAYARLAASTGEPAALANLGAALAAAGAYPQAISAFAAAASRETDPQRRAADWFNAGNAALRSGDYAQAIALYDRAIAAHDAADIRYNRALAQALLQPPPPQPQAQPQGSQSQESEASQDEGSSGGGEADAGEQHGEPRSGAEAAAAASPQAGSPSDAAASAATPRDATPSRAGEPQAPANRLGVMLRQRIELLEEADPGQTRRGGRDEGKPW